MKFLIILLGSLLLLSSLIDSKKIKNEKAVKGKETKRDKREAEVKKPKEIVKEIIVEKFVQPPPPRYQPAEEEEGHQHSHQDPHYEEHVQEHFVEHVASRPKAVKPKTLRVLSAYEQCKAECRKERDSVHAHDYVQQLRDELVAAEAALEEQKRQAEQENETAHEPVISQ